MDWKCVWAAQSKHGVRYLPLKRSELTEARSMAPWRASTGAGCSPVFSRLMRAVEASYGSYIP